MKEKVWKIEVSAYNGTVTMFNEVSLFSTKELAQKVLQCVKEANAKNKDCPFRMHYTGPAEICIFSKESEIPLFNEEKK